MGFVLGAVALPFKVARTLTDIALGLLPSGDSDDEVPTNAGVDVETMIAADDAMTREREPVEEAAIVLDDDAGHVDTEVEVVAESADPEATEPPGPEIHFER